MLPEQYRYLVWQLALLSSGRRWLSLPFDKMQSKRANKHTSAPARSARWLRILESFSILFWFECFSCLFFFPRTLLPRETIVWQWTSAIQQYLVFDTFLKTFTKAPSTRIRIFLKPHISQFNTNWPPVHTKPVKDVKPLIHPRPIRIKKKYPDCAWTGPG